jgi:hypothetical protein
MHTHCIFINTAHAEHAARLSSTLYSRWLESTLKDEQPLTVPGLSDIYVRAQDNVAFAEMPIYGDAYNATVMLHIGRYRLQNGDNRTTDSKSIKKALPNLDYQAMLYVIALVQHNINPTACLTASPTPCDDYVKGLVAKGINSRVERDIYTAMVNSKTSFDKLAYLFSCGIGRKIKIQRKPQYQASQIIEKWIAHALPQFGIPDSALPANGLVNADGMHIKRYDNDAKQALYALKRSLLIELGLDVLLTRVPHLLELAVNKELPNVMSDSTHFNLNFNELMSVKKTTTPELLEILKGLRFDERPLGSYALKRRGISQAPRTKSSSTWSLIKAIYAERISMPRHDGFILSASGESRGVSRLPKKFMNTWATHKHNLDHMGLHAVNRGVVSALWFGRDARHRKIALDNDFSKYGTVYQGITEKTSNSAPLYAVGFMDIFEYLHRIFGTKDKVYEGLEDKPTVSKQRSSHFVPHISMLRFPVGSHQQRNQLSTFLMKNSVVPAHMHTSANQRPQITITKNIDSPISMFYANFNYSNKHALSRINVSSPYREDDIFMLKDSPMIPTAPRTLTHSQTTVATVIGRLYYRLDKNGDVGFQELNALETKQTEALILWRDCFIRLSEISPPTKTRIAKMLGQLIATPNTGYQYDAVLHYVRVLLSSAPPLVNVKKLTPAKPKKPVKRKTVATKNIAVIKPAKTVVDTKPMYSFTSLNVESSRREDDEST